MKVLYAIQGTGNGHLSRAKDVIPALLKRVQVDILISGIQADVTLPYEVKYRYKGLSFIFGKRGGVDIFNTFKKNNFFNLYKEIKACPVEDYDLVINDFEPISAWACKIKGIDCISLSHQSALLSSKVPRPLHRDFLGSLILKYYAPALQHYGFHFKKFDSNIYLPIIRSAIRELKVTEKKHYTVYLPSYSDEKIIKVLNKIPETKWHVFSKHSVKSYKKKNVKIKPINSNKFEKSIASCKGVICGAGFEAPAEALFLKKKLLVIPMSGQYEQHYNAAALKEMGVTVLKKLKTKSIYKIQDWVSKDASVVVNYPDRTQFIVDAILYKYIIASEFSNQMLQEI